MQPDRVGRPRRPAARSGLLRTGWRWLTRLNPLHSWLLLMAVIVGLSLAGLRVLALLVAVAWTGYAIFTWLSPAVQRRLRRAWRRWAGRQPGRG